MSKRGDFHPQGQYGSRSSGSNPRALWRKEASTIIEFVSKHTDKMTEWERQRVVEWGNPEYKISERIIRILRVLCNRMRVKL